MNINHALTTLLPGGAVPPLRRGSRGPHVRQLQDTLVKWMPSWKGKLAQDGVYGPQTARAVAFFKRIYGLGKDGNRVDPATAQALQHIRSGRFWQDPPEMQLPRAYEKARKRGYPFNPAAEMRALPPHQWVEVQGHALRAQAAAAYYDFEGLLPPGYRALITCTTEGTHSDPNHPDGKAVDVVILDSGGGDISDDQSEYFARLAEQAGFRVFNEYLYDSAYKTGDHLHLSL